MSPISFWSLLLCLLVTLPGCAQPEIILEDRIEPPIKLGPVHRIGVLVWPVGTEEQRLLEGTILRNLEEVPGRPFNIYGQFVPDVQRKGNDDLGQGDSTPGGQCVNVHGKIRRGEPSGNQVLLDRSSGQGGLRRKGFHEGDKLSDRKMTDSVPEEENGEKDRFVPGLSQAPVLKKGDGNAGRDRPLLKVRDKA